MLQSLHHSKHRTTPQSMAVVVVAAAVVAGLAAEMTETAVAAVAAMVAVQEKERMVAEGALAVDMAEAADQAAVVAMVGADQAVDRAVAERLPSPLQLRPLLPLQRQRQPSKRLSSFTAPHRLRWHTPWQRWVRRLDARSAKRMRQ